MISDLQWLDKRVVKIDGPHYPRFVRQAASMISASDPLRWNGFCYTHEWLRLAASLAVDPWEDRFTSDYTQGVLVRRFVPDSVTPPADATMCFAGSAAEYDPGSLDQGNVKVLFVGRDAYAASLGLTDFNITNFDFLPGKLLHTGFNFIDALQQMTDAAPAPAAVTGSVPIVSDNLSISGSPFSWAYTRNLRVQDAIESVSLTGNWSKARFIIQYDFWNGTAWVPTYEQLRHDGGPGTSYFVNTATATDVAGTFSFWPEANPADDPLGRIFDGSWRNEIKEQTARNGAWGGSSSPGLPPDTAVLHYQINVETAFPSWTVGDITWA